MVNINSALLSELDRFEGELGIPALSNRIQASRPYASSAELVSKGVLTQAQFDRIKDEISIEEIVLSGEARDIDYLAKLGLMRGHLIVARELLDRKEPKRALPHFGHPVEEIYLDIEPQLEERGVKEFKSSLLELQQLVQFSPNSSRLNAAFARAELGLDGAMASVPDNRRRSPGFTLRVIDQVLEAAGAEYTAAIANGKVTARIEYEDSRGFVLFADQLYGQVASALTKKDPQTARDVRASLTRLRAVWPSIEAPATPVLTPEEVRSVIKSVEQAGQKLVAVLDPAVTTR